MKKVYKDVTFNLTTSKQIVEYGEEFTVTLKASGLGAKEGLEIPYRILNSPSPFGSDIVLIDFTYDKNTDYYYLHIILSEELGSNILIVEQLSGPLVVIEKVSDLLYRYKNPLDREEISRSFRATLKTISDDGEVYRGVRAFDFTYSNEYGYFKLDSNLECVKTFKNKISLLSKIDRVFNLSLYYMPEHTTSTLFSNNYTPPEPYPDIPTKTKPKLKIEAVDKFIFEGEEAVFKVSYENIRSNFKIFYEYIDTKDSYNFSNYFYTAEDGFNYLKIPTERLSINTTSVRYLKLWLKEYPLITDTVFINVIPQQKYAERFKPGIYTIPLQPYTSYRITLVAAGGGSGASVNQRGGNWNVNASGTKGEDTFVEFEGFSCIAGGGGLGTDGHWHNGSAYYPGLPQIGGINNIYNIGTTFVVKENIPGNKGTYHERGEQIGGKSVSSGIGDTGYNGAGANGGWGVGDESLATGGASGSGGLVDCTIRNDSSRIRDLKLTVGKGGVAFDLYKVGTWGNMGKNGEHGFAIIRSI